MAAPAPTELILNGQPIAWHVDPAMPLVWAVRDVSNLTGTKHGCDTGSCGACLVDVDGTATPSCALTVGQCAGRSVTTIEGLDPDIGGAVTQAMIAEQAGMCGFCLPGVVVAVTALLRQNTNPDDAAIDATLTNLCRCGTYDRIRRSVRTAVRTLHKPTPQPAPATAQPATATPDNSPKPAAQGDATLPTAPPAPSPADVSAF